MLSVALSVLLKNSYDIMSALDDILGISNLLKFGKGRRDTNGLVLQGRKWTSWEITQILELLPLLQASVHSARWVRRLR